MAVELANWEFVVILQVTHNDLCEWAQMYLTYF
jgi:hypothetical protein